MPRAALRRFGLAALLAALCACSGDGPAASAEGFDFYVLSLSWSPSYCAVEGPDANRRQCAADAAHGFVVHGLWPQHESGWPEFCPLDEADRFVPDALVADYLDIMPSAGLIGHQWRKHGSCSDLDQAGYLAATRQAFETVTLPDVEALIGPGAEASPETLEAAFLEANPGLPEDGIAITCTQGHIMEARLCMTTGFEWRSCPEVDARQCTLPRQAMPLPN